MSTYTVFQLPRGFVIEAEPGRTIMFWPGAPRNMELDFARALAEVLPKAIEIAEQPEKVTA
jgi:hypothetical protein